MKSKGDFSEEWKRDDKFWNFVGIYCGIMIILCLLGIFFMLFINVQSAHAGEMDAWEFNIMGITSADFKDRKVLPMIGGIVTSLVVHEAGHYIVGELTGGDASVKWDSDENMVVMNTDWGNDWNEDKATITAAAGFLFQTGVGGILTAIPSTRHSDFTFGFNTFSSLTGFTYGITGGLHADDVSDVERMNEYWCDGAGTATAFGAGIVNGAFAYISLNKEK